ncbi:MAG: hypothetical protein KJI71_01810 [Patescibacteria group bacterium]|nr:hypothetical protein [Patescibacteria group bacterium]
MNQINIKDKKNINYTVEILEDSFKKEIRNNRPKWSVEYRVRNKNGEMLGHGGFYLNCSSEHQHLEDDKVLNILAIFGANKVKADLDSDETIESKGYNMNVIDCLQLVG